MSSIDHSATMRSLETKFLDDFDTLLETSSSSDEKDLCWLDSILRDNKFVEIGETEFLSTVKHFMAGPHAAQALKMLSIRLMNNFNEDIAFEFSKSLFEFNFI